MKFVVGYSLYYVLGYYSSKIKLTKCRKVMIQIFLIISIVLAFFLSCRDVIDHGAGCQEIYTDFSVLGFVISVGILLWFRSVFEKDTLCLLTAKQYQKFRRFITNLVYYGIGIYLLHPLLLFLIDDLKGLKCLAGGVILWAITVVVMKIISMLPIRDYFLGNRKIYKEYIDKN